jgi:hypothetical protein
MKYHDSKEENAKLRKTLENSKEEKDQLLKSKENNEISGSDFEKDK